MDQKKFIYHIIQNLILEHEHSSGFIRQAEAMRYTDPEVEKIYREEEQNFVNKILLIFNMYKDKLKIKDYEAGALIIQNVINEFVHSICIFKPRTDGIDDIDEIDEKRLINELVEMISRYLFG